ncbi:MAG: hypothetical protein ACYDAG_09945 [Chloroflexota bacterium]
MALRHFLFNIHARSLLGSYETEDEALQDVSKGVAFNGRGRTGHLLLTCDAGGGTTERVAGGRDVERLALSRFPVEQHRRSA